MQQQIPDKDSNYSLGFRREVYAVSPVDLHGRCVKKEDILLRRKLSEESVEHGHLLCRVLEVCRLFGNIWLENRRRQNDQL